MYNIYYELMEKYSYYIRKELESNGYSLKEQWEFLKKKIISDCNIKKIGYKLDLKDEKKIGKAKVVNAVITNEDAFAHLENINYNVHNAYLLSKNYLV